MRKTILFDKLSVLMIFPIFEILGDRDVERLRVHFSDTSDHYNATVHHNATVFFLHGQGGSGTSMKNWMMSVRGLPPASAFIKWVFPTAPERPYAFMGGRIKYVWFDREVISPDEPEDLESMKLSIQGLSDIIREEEHSGISLRNMVIGGYSTGGQIALHMAYRFFPQMRGVFALSSFLPNDSIVYEHINQTKLQGLPIAYLSTNEDSNFNVSALPEWTEATADQLFKLGVNVTYHKIGYGERLINRQQMNELIQWAESLLQ